MALRFKGSKELWQGERIDADGNACQCVRHPPNIEDVWSDEEIEAAGLEKAPPPEEVVADPTKTTRTGVKLP